MTTSTDFVVHRVRNRIYRVAMESACLNIKPAMVNAYQINGNVKILISASKKVHGEEAISVMELKIVAMALTKLIVLFVTRNLKRK
jgi:hypothetical protein